MYLTISINYRPVHSNVNQLATSVARMGTSLAGPDPFFLTRAKGALKMGLEN